MLELRPYRPADRAAVFEVCVRTADAGGDARGLYSSDALLPDVYAGPYLAYAPELATVVDDGSGVVGYLLGVADTADFVHWQRRHWLPGFAERYPAGASGAPAPAVSEAEAALVAAALRPESLLIAELDAYPAHLHIDLLPSAQGRGLGRTLVEGFTARMRRRGVPGVHLGYAPQNVAAARFYARLGFVPLASSTADAPLVGIRTGLTG